MSLRNMLPEAWRGERAIWNPTREMSRLQRKIDQIFDEFLEEPLSLTPSKGIFGKSLFTPSEDIAFAPACDVEETKTHFLMSFDLPGVKKDDVKIELQNNELVVSGERKEEKHEEAKGRVTREKYYGTFCRSFTLPSNVDSTKVEARYENGVLQIAVPKSETSTGKQIAIKEGKLLESKTKAA